MEYTKLEQESQRKDKSVAVPDSWPKYGIITSEGLYYSHHHTLPYVLKKLNFCIRAEEKVIRPKCYRSVCSLIGVSHWRISSSERSSTFEILIMQLPPKPFAQVLFSVSLVQTEVPRRKWKQREIGRGEGEGLGVANKVNE